MNKDIYDQRLQALLVREQSVITKEKELLERELSLNQIEQSLIQFSLSLPSHYQPLLPLSDLTALNITPQTSQQCVSSTPQQHYTTLLDIKHDKSVGTMVHINSTDAPHTINPFHNSAIQTSYYTYDILSSSSINQDGISQTTGTTQSGMLLPTPTPVTTPSQLQNWNLLQMTPQSTPSTIINTLQRPILSSTLITSTPQSELSSIVLTTSLSSSSTETINKNNILLPPSYIDVALQHKHASPKTPSIYPVGASNNNNNNNQSFTSTTTSTPNESLTNPPSLHPQSLPTSITLQIVTQLSDVIDQIKTIMNKNKLSYNTPESLSITSTMRKIVYIVDQDKRNPFHYHYRTNLHSYFDFKRKNPTSVIMLRSSSIRWVSIQMLEWVGKKLTSLQICDLIPLHHYLNEDNNGWIEFAR